MTTELPLWFHFCWCSRACETFHCLLRFEWFPQTVERSCSKSLHPSCKCLQSLVLSCSTSSPTNPSRTSCPLSRPTASKSTVKFCGQRKQEAMLIRSGYCCCWVSNSYSLQLHRDLSKKINKVQIKKNFKCIKVQNSYKKMIRIHCKTTHSRNIAIPADRARILGILSTGIREVAVFRSALLQLHSNHYNFSQLVNILALMAIVHESWIPTWTFTCPETWPIESMPATSLQTSDMQIPLSEDSSSLAPSLWLVPATACGAASEPHGRLGSPPQFEPWPASFRKSWSLPRTSPKNSWQSCCCGKLSYVWIYIRWGFNIEHWFNTT